MKKLGCFLIGMFGLVNLNFINVMHASAETLERELVLSGKKLLYLESGAGGSTTVLLLHGARFSSATWLELGTIDVLAEAGHHVIALDLPGFGRSQTVDIERDQLLIDVMDALGVDRAVVVAPSMSGVFSFPLVIRATERVLGFVPVAPAGIDENIGALRKVSVPMLVVWGENDRIVPLEKSDVLAAAIPDSRRVILKGASHPAYLDRPEEFHEELLTFVASVQR